MELELKHIAPYLPYGLRVLDTDNDGRYFKETVRTVDVVFKSIETIEGVSDDINKFIPILKPISHLSKKINHNGLSFVPLEILLKMKYPKWDNENEGNHYGKITIDNEFRYATAFYQNQANYSIYLDKQYLLNTNYATLTKLIEWHFDVFGLIEKGLAVSYTDV